MMMYDMQMHKSNYRNLPLIQVEAWLRLDEVQVGGDLLVFEDQNRLNQAGETTGRLRVANVGLNRAHVQVPGPGLLSEDVAQRLHLGDITCLGTRTVGLHIWSFGRVEMHIAVYSPDQSLLGLRVRERDSVSLAILVGAGVPNEGVDRVPVCKCVSQPLNNDDSNTFSATVSSSSTVERVTLAVWVEHTGRVKPVS